MTLDKWITLDNWIDKEDEGEDYAKCPRCGFPKAVRFLYRASYYCPRCQHRFIP